MTKKLKNKLTSVQLCINSPRNVNDSAETLINYNAVRVYNGRPFRSASGILDIAYLAAWENDGEIRLSKTRWIEYP